MLLALVASLAWSATGSAGDVFLLVANTASRSVGVCQVGPDGSLSQVAGSPFAMPGAPSELLSLGKDTLLVASAGSGPGGNQLSTFRYDASTGRLAPAHNLILEGPGSETLSGIPVGPNTVLFAQGQLGLLRCLRFDPATGTLTETDKVAISGTRTNDTTCFESFVLASNAGTNDISVYLVDTSRGKLSQVSGSPFPNPQARDIPGSIFCVQGHVFVTNQKAGTISRLGIDPATGRLSPLGITPCGGTKPGGMTTLAGPDTLTLFVCNQGSDTLSAFDVGRAGELSPVPGYPVPAGGSDPRELSVLKLGDGSLVLYVSTAEHVAGFSLDPGTRFPTPLAGSPFSGFDSPGALDH